MIKKLNNYINNKMENNLKENSYILKLWKQRQLLFLISPFFIFILVFNFLPLWGWIMAFLNYKPYLGISGSKWVGLDNFKAIFSSPMFFKALRNTVGISSLKLLFGFFSTIALALILNEVKNIFFKRTVQTISYLPHFVSWVVAANIVFIALSPEDGIVNEILLKFGLVSEPINFLGIPEIFWFIAAVSDVWKEIGWGAIIYLAAIAGIEPELYEAASIDGAGRIKKIFAITLPSIFPLIKILLILNLGWILYAGFEQIYLLQKPATWDYSEILDIHILKYGIQMGRWSYATAAGIFNSVVGLTLVMLANRISKKLGGEKAF